MDTTELKTIEDLKREDPDFDFTRAYNLYGRHNTESLATVFVSEVDERERSLFIYSLNGQKIEIPHEKLFSICCRRFGTEEISKLSFITKNFWTDKKQAESQLEEYIKKFHKEFIKLETEKQILEFVNKPYEE